MAQKQPGGAKKHWRPTVKANGKTDKGQGKQDKGQRKALGKGKGNWCVNMFIMFGLV